MKLSGRDAKAFLAKPEPGAPAILLYGPDPMRVALARRDLCAALAGDEAEEEMRLTRIEGGDLRRDPATLNDALSAQGFFPGPRVVVAEGVTDSGADAIGTALADWRAGDAVLIVTEGQLTPRARLRKLFEGHAEARAIALYPDPPSRAEIETELSRAGLAAISTEAMGDLHDLARALEPGDFRQLIEKLSLYKYGDPAPLTPQELAICAPATIEAGLDAAIDIVAEGRIGELGPMLARLSGQGVNPTQLCIGAVRHFRRLHQAASDPRGAEAGVSALRPPVPFMRKDRMARQSQSWGMRRLEAALRVLIETDLTLRSSRPVPQMALIERGLIRIAMMAAR